MNVHLALLLMFAAPQDFPKPHDTQKETQPVLKPADAARALAVPKGFKTTVFAAEPQVRQPIAMTLDSRGRLWVAENYTYAKSGVNYDRKLRDRIVILEDSDRDGVADRRKVFWDQGKLVTSLEVGFGGVWVLDTPRLIFIPDKNGDDVPDGEPQVILDGWTERARHNFVNGLRWGPDGWLYGRHGITAPSLVGPPGSLAGERKEIRPGIWRIHPVSKALEYVSEGTTNPWGMDWDEHGELFYINTVIGHLWHAIPGSHYRRMYGEDPTPHVYRLIEQVGDHFHWATGEHWGQAKKGMSDETSRRGGGHAHSGLLIYQGKNWPEQYRGGVFTVNLHGLRINYDVLERGGATYVARHRPDFAISSDVYFRGLELLEGPHGEVYVADWSDIGECHENDGVHRSSGRIFRITWGDLKGKPFGNLADRSNEELARLAVEGGTWLGRTALRLIHERRSGAEVALKKAYRDSGSVSARLRAMWALHVAGKTDEPWLIEQLADEEEHVRIWAIRLLVDKGTPSEAAIRAMEKAAAVEKGGLALTYFASAMQKLPADNRWRIAASIAAHGKYADDRVLPLMLWYGVRDAVPVRADEAVALAEASSIPLVSRFIARRLTYESERHPKAMGRLVKAVGKGRRELLEGMADALRGVIRAEAPPGWKDAAAALEGHADQKVKSLARELSVVFGDGRAAGELRKIASSKNADVETRRRAVRALVDSKAPDLVPMLVKLLGRDPVASEAVRGIAILDPRNAPKILLNNFGKLYRPGKNAVVEALSSRVSYAEPLLEAVEREKIKKRELTAFQLRRMQLFENEKISARIQKLWPDLRLLGADKVKRISGLRRDLSAERLAKADRKRGEALYTKSCGKCHKLFGQGGAIGPELTGAQRGDLSYLLENIVDPSASVAEQHRMSLIRLKDGRIVNGVIVERTERTLAVQTPEERLVLDRTTVDRVKASTLSLMPEGLLDVLSKDQIADMIAYLMGAAPPE